MGNIHTMTNKILTTGIFAVLLCLFLQTPSFAGVYKWVDQDGQVHYGDQPNKPGAKEFTVLKNTTTKPRPIKKTEKDGKNPEDKNKEKTAEKPAEPEKPKISKKEKKRLCNEAKNDITSISSRGRMREINAKGEYSYLSEKQRQQRLAAAKKKQREFCR